MRRGSGLVLPILLIVTVHGSPAAAQVVTSPARPPVLTIDTVVERVLARNVALEAARLRVDLARAEQIAAALRPNPTLTLSAENLKVSGPTPAGELYEVSATVSQPLELGGRRRSRREVADARVALAEAQLAEALNERVSAAKRTLFEAALARRTIEHARNTREGFDRLVEFNQIRFEEGAIPEGELVKARLERSRSDAAIGQAQLTLRQALIRLRELLGVSDVAAEDVGAELSSMPAVVADLDSLRELALRHRPSLRAAEETVALATRQIALERARGRPDIAPFLGLKRVGENNTVLLGIAVPLPLSDRNQGGIARAVAEEKVAQTEVAVQRSRALAEVDAAWESWRGAQERAAAFESTLLPQAEESETIARAAYEEGAIDLFAYLEAQRTHADIRQQHAQALFDAHTSVLLLEQAVGRELLR